MESIVRFFVVLATAATITFPVAAPTRHRAAGPGTGKAPVYSADQLEAYLGDDGIAYIRPGLKLNIASITSVAPGKKPVVEFYLTDSLDQPLDRLGKVTPGPRCTTAPCRARCSRSCGTSRRGGCRGDCRRAAPAGHGTCCTNWRWPC